MALDAERVLGERITGLLGDKNYEKRMTAALDIESLVREAVRRNQGNHSQVQKILDCLRREYVESQNPNCRKGGLIGLASVSAALDKDIRLFLPQLATPVLELFQDDDARVRFYACEAMYNVSKRADDAILSHFNQVFDGLCRLYADVDQEVLNGVQHLDRLMKDIATQHASQFRAADFIPLLARRMEAKNPYIRQLVLAWISLLMSVPEFDMVRYLPQYLEGLFNMLGDPSRDIKHNADACLTELLSGKHGVKASSHEDAVSIISNTASTVVRACFADESCTRLTALCWVHEFVRLQSENKNDLKPAESWIGLLPGLLSGALHCIEEKGEIASMAVEVHQELIEMVSNLSSDIPVVPLVDKLLESMQSKGMEIRTACLEWICMLLKKSPAKMLHHDSLHKLYEPVFDTLLHAEDEVVVAALQVLTRIMEGRDAIGEGDDAVAIVGATKEVRAEHLDLFTDATHRLLRLFASDRKMFESRGQLAIRQLCAHLDPKRLYVTVARAIACETNPEFAQQLVQTFSWILLTAKETKSVRDELRAMAPLPMHRQNLSEGSPAQGASNEVTTGVFGKKSARSLFVELLVPWFHNPVSALALSLWAQQYVLAEGITVRFAEREPDLVLLRQLDELVHLLESPVFAHLRLQLLDPRRHPSLVRCLLGLAMLLPQASAFQVLCERIRVVQGGLLEAAPVELPRSGVTQESTGVLGSLFRSNSESRAVLDVDGPSRVPTGVADDIPSLLERFSKVLDTMSQ